MRPASWVLFIVAGIGATARGDGGAVRLSERAGRWRVTVFTTPTPLQAGMVDVSVLVQDAGTGDPEPDVRVTIHLTSAEQQDRKLSMEAVHAAATNRLFQATQCELSAGSWSLVVDVEAAGERARVSSNLEVGPAPPHWLDLWIWLALPLLAIVGFAAHQFVVHRREKASESRPATSVHR